MTATRERPTASPFARYIAKAGPKRGFWRAAVGLVLILAAWIGWTALVLWGAMDAGIGLERPGSGFDPGTPLALAVVLATFGGLWGGVWLAMRFCHGGGLGGVLGPGARSTWAGLALGLLAYALSVVLAMAVGITPTRTALDLSSWAVWLLPTALLVAVQAGGEELLFRGYLLQRLARGLRHPLIWAGVPALLFGLLHYDPSLPGVAGVLYVATTAMFGLAAAVLVWRTGALWAAIGLHTGINLGGLTGIGIGDFLAGMQLGALPKAESERLLALDALTSLALLVLVCSRWCPVRAPQR